MIIWLASYPRSGNTYFRAVLRHYFSLTSFSLYGDPLDIGRNRDLGALVGHKDGNKSSLDISKLRKSNEVYFIKTHELPGGLISQEDKVFHIVRDGRDASASYLKYLHIIMGRASTTLEDVLLGAVPFGSWGNHVLQWHRAPSENRHTFKFEHITASPDLFAERLSGVLRRERSREPFPDIETFRHAAPSFVGSGRSGSYKDVFSEMHLTLFELCSGPAMRLAGYEPDELSDEQIAAFAAFCEHSMKVAGLERTVGKLNAALGTVRADLERERHRPKATRDRHTRHSDVLETKAPSAREQRNWLIRYSGLGAIRWMAARVRKYTRGARARAG